MMFGVGENYENRVNHFQQLYDLQEETGGFTAFIPWSFQPHNTALGGRHWDEATAVEYLKVLAISRLYLSNFLNVQSSWVTQGLKVCQMGLRFGGNDVGSVMLEENVVRAAGVTNCTTEEELRRIIRDAGFRPAQRDTLYRQHFLNSRVIPNRAPSPARNPLSCPARQTEKATIFTACEITHE
jgi:cyclic dehypoxanthinyl futalosine synthase